MFLALFRYSKGKEVIYHTNKQKIFKNQNDKIYSSWRKKKIAILTNDYSVEFFLNLDSTYNTGDIYLGKVVSILDNLNVAFIKLDEWKQNGFMVIKDDLFLNLKKNINLGEEIIVQITKEQVSKKGPTISQEIIRENE